MSSDNLANSRVLIVDDNSANLGILYTYLDRAGLEVLVAQTGEKAVELVRSQRPDIVLLDIMLPGIDGFEACKQMKQDRETREIPIIFISALAEIEDKVKGFEVGGVDYITKPFQQEEVLARTRAHLTIKKQREELNELSAMKDRFISIIAHDLKGPFSGFLGASDLILEAAEAKDVETLKEIAHSLRDSAEKTYSLLENLLEWARRNKTQYDPQVLDVYRHVYETVQLFIQGTKQKGIRLQIDIPEDLKIKADRGMFDTILRNLVNNAVKFTDEGGEITVSAENGEGHVDFYVSDTGIGMADQQKRELFRIDSRVQERGTQGEVGTGLGLLLVRDYVERHGGTIDVESEPGKGSTFHFTIPCADPDGGSG